MRLTLDIPDEQARQLQELADREFRTPEAQILWLIHQAFAGRRTLLTDRRTAASAALHTEIGRLYAAAGCPSTRQIAAWAAENGSHKISHTTVHQALTSARPITWSVAEALCSALHGDREKIRALWIEAQEDARG